VLFNLATKIKMKKYPVVILLFMTSNVIAMDYCRVTIPDKKAYILMKKER